VLRRLAGLTLAEKDQVRIQFENEFRGWCETKASSRLLTGKDLTIALRNRQSLIQGDDAAQKDEYLGVSVRRRTRFRIAALAVVVVLAACGYQSVRWADAWIQRDRLSKWGLPPALFEAQFEVDSMQIKAPNTPINTIGSLRSI
jgi:hypothetical protein